MNYCKVQLLNQGNNFLTHSHSFVHIFQYINHGNEIAPSKNKQIGGKMKNICKNERGQGVMEYIIISSLIGIFCLVAVKQFGNVIQKRIEHMKQVIVKNISIK